jgi:hypothetical protein
MEPDYFITDPAHRTLSHSMIFAHTKTKGYVLITARHRHPSSHFLTIFPSSFFASVPLPESPHSLSPDYPSKIGFGG